MWNIFPDDSSYIKVLKAESLLREELNCIDLLALKFSFTVTNPLSWCIVKCLSFPLFPNIWNSLSPALYINLEPVVLAPWSNCFNVKIEWATDPVSLDIICKLAAGNISWGLIVKSPSIVECPCLKPVDLKVPTIPPLVTVPSEAIEKTGL